ncbi:MAG: hypothetical protein RLZZ224_1615 [Verrucomicrobiota bacterium]
MNVRAPSEARKKGHESDGADGGSCFDVYYADAAIALGQMGLISLHNRVDVISGDRADRGAVGSVDDPGTAAFEFDCV